MLNIQGQPILEKCDIRSKNMIAITIVICIASLQITSLMNQDVLFIESFSVMFMYNTKLILRAKNSKVKNRT